MSNAKHSKGSAEHYTPIEYVDAARDTMGDIDLDPASCEHVNEAIVEAATFYDAQSNGIAHKWDGRVFLNPPGGLILPNGLAAPEGVRGESSAKVWWFKLASEFALGNVEAAIFVGFSIEILQSTQHDALSDRLPIPLDFPLCFPRKRIQFYQRHGDAYVRGGSPTHANVIAFVSKARDERRAAFVENFSKFGRVVVPAAPKKKTTKKGGAK